MDTIKLLLGITVALLVGALAMSWKNFRQEVRGTPAKELAEVKRQIAQIEQERQALEQERKRLLLGQALAPAPAAEPEITELPPGEAPETGAVFADEVDEPAAPTPPVVMDDNQRAKAIESAPVLAKVNEWVEEPELGTFATLEIVDAAQVKVGTVLCVRRKSGIIGRLKITEIHEEGVIADPVAVFGALKPEKGDELILEP